METFGEFVKQCRTDLGMTTRELCSKVGISVAYLCDIENGNRKAPVNYLQPLADALGVCEPEELHYFYDLAGRSNNGVHPDITAYMENRPAARVAMRTAMDRNLSDEDWVRMIEQIRNYRRTGNGNDCR